MYFLYCIFFLVLACNNSHIDLGDKWNKAVDFRQTSKLKESITLFKEIVELGKDDLLVVKAQYQIADIYLNDINDYTFAIQEFQKLIKNYPDSDYTKKSIFMLVYINSNYIDSYSDAIYYYDMFLEKYPSDDLTYSVNYVLGLLDSIGIMKDLEKLRNK